MNRKDARRTTRSNQIRKGSVTWRPLQIPLVASVTLTTGLRFKGTIFAPEESRRSWTFCCIWVTSRPLSPMIFSREFTTQKGQVSVYLEVPRLVESELTVKATNNWFFWSSLLDHKLDMRVLPSKVFYMVIDISAEIGRRGPSITVFEYELSYLGNEGHMSISRFWDKCSTVNDWSSWRQPLESGHWDKVILRADGCGGGERVGHWNGNRRPG